MKNAFLKSALLLLIACEREQVQLKPFANTKWTLTAIQNTSTNSIIYYPETLTKESIVFVDSISTLHGTGVCNGCGGTYTMDSVTVKIKILGCTQISCKGDEWEDYLFGNLDSTYKYKIDFNQLTFYSKGTYNLIFYANN